MKAKDLLQVAELLAKAPVKGRLKQACRRRSMSTSYYALFHAVATLCADELVGPTRSKTDAWMRTYRALEHASAKNGLLELARRFDDRNMMLLSETFAALQQFRHDADYNPRLRYWAGNDGGCLVLATMGIDAALALPPPLRSEVATSLLLKSRRL